MTQDDDDPGVEQALDAIFDEALAEKLGIGEKASWVPYEGPQGGVGWENTETGEKHYGETPPGGTPSGVPDTASEIEEQIESGELTREDLEQAYAGGGDEGDDEITDEDIDNTIDEAVSQATSADEAGVIARDLASDMEGIDEEGVGVEARDKFREQYNNSGDPDAGAGDDGISVGDGGDFAGKQMDIAREELEDGDEGGARSRAASAARTAVDDGQARDQIEEAFRAATTKDGGMGPTTHDFDPEHAEELMRDQDYVDNEHIEAVRGEYAAAMDELGLDNDWAPSDDKLATAEELEEKLDRTIDEVLDDKGFSDALAAKAGWIPYQGPRGGEGWKNTETGDVTYDDEPPGEVSDDAVGQMEGAVANRLQQASRDDLEQAYEEMVGGEAPSGMGDAEVAQEIVDEIDEHQLAGLAQEMGAEPGAAAGSSDAIETDGSEAASEVSEGDRIVIDDTETEVSKVTDMGGGFYVAARDDEGEVHTARVGPDHEFETVAGSLDAGEYDVDDPEALEEIWEDGWDQTSDDRGVLDDADITFDEFAKRVEEAPASGTDTIGAIGVVIDDLRDDDNANEGGAKSAANLDESDLGERVSFASGSDVVEGELVDVGDAAGFDGQTRVRVQPEGQPDDWPAQPYRIDDDTEVVRGGGSATVDRDGVGLARDYGEPTDGRGGDARVMPNGDIDMQLGWNDASEAANMAGYAAEQLEAAGDDETARALRDARDTIKDEIGARPSTGDPADTEVVQIDGEAAETLYENVGEAENYMFEQNFPEDDQRQARYTRTMLENVLASAQRDAEEQGLETKAWAFSPTSVVDEIRSALGGGGV